MFLISSSLSKVTHVCGIIVTSALYIGIPASSRARRTSLKSFGSVEFQSCPLLPKIFCSCIQCLHHQIICIQFTFFFIDNDLSFLIKHERNTSTGSDISLSLCEALLTLEAVRLRLSVSASTMIAVPFGPYPSCIRCVRSC